MRKPHLPFLLLLSLFMFSFIANAAQDTTSIDLSLTKVDYVNFIGTADGVSKYFSVTDIEPAGNQGPGPRVTVGTLGLNRMLRETVS